MTFSPSGSLKKLAFKLDNDTIIVSTPSEYYETQSKAITEVFLRDSIALQFLVSFRQEFGCFFTISMCRKFIVLKYVETLFQGNKLAD